ncbi:ankyrin repeat-containing domain protein [Xylariales sp. PMI_506]|nr:ankyrin repeat-containing domain protein [Xylariales sp. PMI_506]
MNPHVSQAFLEFLISKGADVNAPAYPGSQTALQAAVIRNSLNAVTLLLHQGADVNAIGGSLSVGLSMSALDWAARIGSIDMVHLLLYAGAHSGIRNVTNFDGAIRYARRAGHYEICRILTREGSLSNFKM